MNNLQIKAGMHLHNYFLIRKIRNGECVQEARAENVVLNTIWNFFTSTSMGYDKTVALGKGSGTPAATDTALFSSLWTYSLTYDGTTVQDDNHITAKYSCLIPATTSYIGTVTEVGINHSGTLITHAMLKDAEGNNISIQKTDTDELEITCILYVSQENLDPNFKLAPMKDGNLWNGLYSWSIISRQAYGGYQSSPLKPFMLCYSTLQDNGDDTLLANCMSKSTYGGTDVGATNRCLGASSTTPNLANKQWSSVFNRLDVAKGMVEQGMTYVHRIALFGQYYYPNSITKNVYRHSALGYFDFPNALFEPYTLQNLSIGVGDGSTKEFTCPIPLFMPETDVVYVDGVAQTRGVDYTIDPAANSQRMSHVSPGYLAKVISGATGKNYSLSPFRFIGMTVTSDASWNARGISLAKPLILDFTNISGMIDKRVNFWRFGYMRVMSNNSSSQYGDRTMTGVQFILSYSDDKDSDTWTEAARVAVDSTTVTSTSDTKYGGWVAEVQFDHDIVANYWKISVDVSNATASNTKTIGEDAVFFMNSGYGGLAAGKEPFLGHYNPKGIVFTNPPAADAVITMEAKVDRPFKTNRFVFDTSVAIKYQ